MSAPRGDKPARKRVIAVAVAVSLAVIAAAVVLGVRWMQDRPTVAPAPPTTAEVTPSGELSPAQLAEYDQRLITTLRSKGLAIENPRMTARDAHLLCARLQGGQSVEQAKRDYAQVIQGDVTVAEVFVSTVMAIYPSCP
ncbi:DUF732 domain-containing protein [Mycolicibacterium canariasense]|uniref:DUF732 domain-containing protein n=1 Tax=Mycolicibacterium canariasense TaxID=228230 RepID=UPI0007879A49|nr:DUF732 domain-containing protein [Mycolicibacterium canariasense]MCV7213199.1 DUF732 domain-containing protein [Mycolicibacterium canariasense]ORV00863.1 hypothetical protein AWB94_26575 [Mycolicibacterium canariasense]